jgi:hypothetical protein
VGVQSNHHPAAQDRPSREHNRLAKHRRGVNRALSRERWVSSMRIRYSVRSRTIFLQTTPTGPTTSYRSGTSSRTNGACGTTPHHAVVLTPWAGIGEPRLRLSAAALSEKSSTRTRRGRPPCSRRVGVAALRQEWLAAQSCGAGRVTSAILRCDRGRPLFCCLRSRQLSLERVLRVKKHLVDRAVAEALE